MYQLPLAAGPGCLPTRSVIAAPLLEAPAASAEPAWRKPSPAVIFRAIVETTPLRFFIDLHPGFA